MILPFLSIYWGVPSSNKTCGCVPCKKLEKLSVFFNEWFVSVPFGRLI